MKRKTVHFVNGCPWANGQKQSSDTFQTRDWKLVTCKYCMRPAIAGRKK